MATLSIAAGYAGLIAYFFLILDRIFVVKKIERKWRVMAKYIILFIIFITEFLLMLYSFIVILPVVPRSSSKLFDKKCLSRYYAIFLN